MKKWCEKLKGNLFFVSQFALDDFKNKICRFCVGIFLGICSAGLLRY